MVEYTCDARGSPKRSMSFGGSRDRGSPKRRFISIDDVAYIDPETIGGTNLFAYCNNNPVMYTDMTGRSWESFWQGVGRFFAIVWNNLSGDIGISLGVGLETDIGIFVINAISRTDIIGVQFKNGQVRVGRPNKSSFSGGFQLGPISIVFGPISEGFESFDYSVREYDDSYFDISIGTGKCAAFAIGAHFGFSFSISGFAGDIKEWINE